MLLHFASYIHMSSETCCQEASLQYKAATTLVDTVLSTAGIECLNNPTMFSGH